VDDEPNIVSSIRRVLYKEKDKYNVFTASGASEALLTLDSNLIDVVVSDHRMPEMTGVKFLAEVSRRHPQTIRLMLSGEADIHVMVAAINEGNIFKFIGKPWSDSNLRDVVREAANLAMASKLDPTTGWLTKKSFCGKITQRLIISPLTVVVVELRNASAAWGFLSQAQQRALATELEQRCRKLCELALPMASFDGGLIAFATSAGLAEETLIELADQLSVPVDIDGRLVAIQVGLGFSESLIEDRVGSEVISRAMTALNAIDYKANNSVSGYTAKSGIDLRMREQLERDMQDGLVNDEFFLLLQPQVNARTHRIEGAEALIRWQHGEFGLIAPFKFIDIAERTGFIKHIGFWVMKETTRVLQHLLKTGVATVRVSFNVSPVQLIYSETTEIWLSYLSQFAISYPEAIGRLELEVTESAVMTNPRRASQILGQLKDLGVRIALDDFGTGHSSLAQFNKLPIDVLKFDRSLIQHVETDLKNQTLVTHLVNMASDLELETVAEGVETPYQIDFCRALGFSLIQGYAFFKPMLASEFYQVIGDQGDE
jgi:EAL domain-containing protein (putative c-di-GMP-specific phosphodiesterase class I)/DNA-binding response OmpR family regulator